MKTMTIQRERMVWLDWMKVLAILSIIWGHFFSAGYVYLYVFSVQTFCVISGFLYKKSADWKTCLRKCFWQLFVPTVLLSTIMQLEAYLRCEAMGTPYDVSWPWFFQWLLLGHRWCMGPCWYFYTLIVMRLIMQALPERKWVYALLFIALSAGAIVLRQQDIEVSNANVNVLVCMPMFLIGVFLKELKSVANNLSNYFVESVLAVGAGVVVYLCGEYNGEVWMYLCGYGNYYVLYIVGGTAGTLLLYVVSLRLSRLSQSDMMTTLSKGSILIIGLHIVIVRRLTELPGRFCLEDFLFSVMILLLFVPVIHLTEKHFPLLLGQHHRHT
jgi:fucose 4-O-acetylase-like acetyltransferase